MSVGLLTLNLKWLEKLRKRFWKSDLWVWVIFFKRMDDDKSSSDERAITSYLQLSADVFSAELWIESILSQMQQLMLL